jgi:peptidoglycan/LPS O-acetylase OafA/YrhL
MFFIGALWRIPNGLWTLALLDFVPVAIMHLTFQRAQRALAGDAARPTPFRWPEWIVIVLSCAFWALALIGLTVPDEARGLTPFWWAGYVVTAVAAVILLMVRRAESRARLTEDDRPVVGV